MLDSKRWIFVAVAVAGVGVTFYQAWEYVTQNFSSCSVKNTIWSCGGVAAWAKYHPITVGSLSIPYWETGVVWFPLALILGFVTFRYYSELYLIPFLMIGNIFTIYLWFLELHVIGLICPVCVALYAINYALTGIAVWIVAT
jgi:uncharacterized membrane protein